MQRLLVSFSIVLHLFCSGTAFGVEEKTPKETSEVNKKTGEYANFRRTYDIIGIVGTGISTGYQGREEEKHVGPLLAVGLEVLLSSIFSVHTYYANFPFEHNYSFSFGFKAYIGSDNWRIRFSTELGYLHPRAPREYPFPIECCIGFHYIVNDKLDLSLIRRWRINYMFDVGGSITTCSYPHSIDLNINYKIFTMRRK